MKRLLYAVVLMMTARAEEFRAQGYGGYAPMWLPYEEHDHGAMLGGDLLFHKGLGINLDLSGGRAFGIFSPALTYHHGKQRVVPFVSTGPALLFAIGAADAKSWQYGGGATFWIKPRFGLRAEIRQLTHFEYRDVRATQLRIGVSWR